MTQPAPLHAFSVDVEEWFHLLECPQVEDWSSLPSRVEAATDWLLELCARHAVQGTFFVLGWVAERHPDLITRITAAGHELGWHSMNHQLLSTLGPERFARDLRRARDLLQQRTGQAVKLYRAPGFSITQDALWAFEVLVQEGFTLDSSVFPAPHAHGGLLTIPDSPCELVTPSGSLLEMPISVASLGRLRLGFAGGGYFRLLPRRVVSALIHRRAQANRPTVFYIHPRDIDSQQPRLPLPILRRMRAYVGIGSALARLEALFREFRFGSLSACAQSLGPEALPRITVPR